MTPFLKYAGCKQKIAPFIIENIKQECEYPIKRIIEPFAGSCAVSLQIEAEDFWINDLNYELINCYEQLISNNKLFMQISQKCFNSSNNTKEKYVEIRNKFNSLSLEKEEDKLLKAVLFFWLNKHCFNGLIRFNKNNKFNVPFGRYEKVGFPEEKLNYFYNHFKNAKFTSLSFETIFENLEAGDVVYCDPPYESVGASVGFQNYWGTWTPDKLTKLLELADKCQKQGILVAISNHDTDLLREQTKQAKKYLDIFVKRTISRDVSTRKHVKEALIIF